jgi:beta-N-acetylhexosaminidase
MRCAVLFLLLCVLGAPTLAAQGTERPVTEALGMARSLEDSVLAAQVLLTGIDGKGTLGPGMRALLGEVPAGGVLLFRYNLSVRREEVAPFLAQVRAAALFRGGEGLAPLIAVDHEGGLVHRLGEGLTRLPPPLSYWERLRDGGDREVILRDLEESAFRSGGELRELGITVNLAPVAETLSPENRDFLGSRSYGPDPAFVEDAASAFIRGMGRAGVVCAVKHFPGSSGDPHRRAVSLAGDRAALNSLVRPLAALLPSAPLVMVSHVRVPAWDAGQSASLSPAVIGGWLRGELGFDGAVLADDFSMAGSSERDNGRAAVAALNAGADWIMCWPSNLAATHRAILAALASGSLPRERLVEAAARIIAVKLRLRREAPGGVP